MAISVQPLPRAGRKIRRPTHTFNIVQHPFAITPFMIAPVIPGETLRNAVFQARSVSAPINNDMQGWWLEHYLFYVKIRDLPDRDALTQMFVDPEWEPTGLTSNTADPWTYFNGRNRINWTQRCLERVTEAYFRDEGEAWNAATYNGLPLAKAHHHSFIDSIMSEDDYQVPGDIDVDADADGTVTAREIEEATRQWQLLKSMNLTEQTYEDFIRSFGVQGDVGGEVDPHRPELIRYEKSWAYPSNTVEVSGVRTVCSWSQNFRADKDRFFKEPGFVFGVTVWRPKLYLGNLSSAGVTLFDHVHPWLPAALNDDAYSSLIHVPDGTGPVTTDPVGYVIDARDLYLHGDQFINHSTSANINSAAFPKATDFDKEYPTSTDIEALFVGTSGDADRQLRTDGIVTMMIASANTKDFTATTGKSIAVTGPE